MIDIRDLNCINISTSRITIFAGHYGSGKTNLALNYALWIRKTGADVTICDLDIVNPYFRTADSTEFLKKNSIKLITSEYANTNVDLPSIPSAAQSVIDNKNSYAVIDLGGDDRGALAIGRYARAIIEENNYEMLLVTNKYRPLTRDADSLIEIKNEIEGVSRIKFTGIVNNSNLGNATTLQDILLAESYVMELSEKIGLPVKMTSVKRQLLNTTGLLKDGLMSRTNLFPIDIYEKTIWKI